MRKLLPLILAILSFVGYCQNWNVFNKGYRYNYKFNNSAVVSNVLIADTVKQIGSDTVYSMNNIAIKSGSTIITDKPQFLMKKIIKKSNGNVQLFDTTNIIIIPTCTLNQSWTFDLSYNLTATCVAISTVNIFATVDSVKTIVINNVDSVKLGKQFGIIQFPKLYAQNQYYKLVGIEKNVIYDSIPLYGERVPNAWDFYDFNVGDQMCLNSYYIHKINTSNFIGNCKLVTRVFNSKSVFPPPNWGYSYSVLDVGRMKNSAPFWGDQYDCMASGPPNQPPITSSNNTLSFFSLHSSGLFENRMYPGMYAPDYNGIVSFGLDNHGTFYKYIGASCQNTLYTVLPNSTLTPSGSGITFGVGLGMIYRAGYVFEGDEFTCVSCFVKGSTTYFGPISWVGLAKDPGNLNVTNFFPNPASNQLNLPVEKCGARLFDPFGKLVKEELLENKSAFDISSVPNGLYFLEIQTDSFKHTQKIIIQH